VLGHLPNGSTYRSAGRQKASIVSRVSWVYQWEETFNAALMEKDQSKLQERIDAAQTAINRRIYELNSMRVTIPQKSAKRFAMPSLESIS
jgi:hypothetical protein